MTQTPVSGRRILILDADLFAQVGGGQSVYHRLIALSPNDQWFYFRRNEAESGPRPANTTAIPLIDVMRQEVGWLPDRLHPFLPIWRMVRNLATSVVGHLGRTDFDVVDVPDYTQFAPFIRLALAEEGCRVGTVALALHGTLSDAFRGGWPTGQDESRILAELRLREQLQFRTADASYAISNLYAEAWRRRSPRAVNHLDPLLITGAPQPAPAERQDGKPDLAFIGRREKWKGPDLFLDAAWCLDPESYRQLLLIGPEGANRLGQGSEALLLAAARRRNLDSRLNLYGNMKRDDVQSLLRGRTLLMLPSRHDTFNLTALEAICRGCPTLISERAGVVAWMRTHLPELDWAVVGLDCGRGMAESAAQVLGDYDRFRDALGQALHRAALVPDMASLQGIYTVTDKPTVKALETAIEIVAQISPKIVDERITRGRPSLRFAAKKLRDGVPRVIRAVPGAGPAFRLSRSTWRSLPAPVRSAAFSAAGRTRAVVQAPGVRGKVQAALWQAGDIVRIAGN